MSDFGFLTASAPNGGAIVPGVTPIIGGVVGRVLFEGAGNVVQESSSLFWDNTNARLGIGTSTPATKLHIKAETTSTSAIIIENPSSGSVYLPTTTYVTGLNQTTAGSNNASYLLMVAGPGSGTPSQGPYFQLNGNLHTAYGGQRGYMQFTSGQVTSPTGNDGKIAFNCASSAIDFNTAGTNKLSIQNNGNVLIGTTTDAGFKLDVNGTARVQGTGTTSATTAFTVTNSAAAYNSLIIRDDGTFVFGNPNNGGGYLAAASNGNITATYFNASLDLGAGRKVTSVQYFSSGSITASSALAQGVYFNNTLVASANNDTLVGLDINPTFTNGAFTGVENIPLRLVSQSNSNVVKNILLKNIGTGNGTGVSIGFNNLNANNLSHAFIKSYYVVPSGMAMSFGTGGGSSLTSEGTTALVLNADQTANFTARVIANSGGFQAIGTSANMLMSDGGTPVITRNGSTGIQFLKDAYWQTFSIFTNNTENLRVASTGNVLINTTTDAGYKLDVNGTARVSSSAQVPLRIDGSAAATGVQINSQADNDLRPSYVEFLRGGVSKFFVGFSYGNSGFYIGDGTNPNFNMKSNGNILIGTFTDVACSKLTIESTTQGFLPPRMTTTQKNAITTPAAGLVVYDTTLNKLCVYTTAWETVTSL